MADPGPVYELLGKLAYAFTEVQPLIPTYAHLIVSALFPIYAGAHASLSRPSSAAKPAKSKKTTPDNEEEDSESEEEDQVQRMEGLSTSDALVFPLMAGVTLTGLYFLIKWLKDPTVLNRILNAYFSIFGLLSVSRFLTDGMDLIHGIVFPRRYTVGRTVYDVHSRAKVAEPLGSPKKKTVSSPLPGIFGRVQLPVSVNAALWKIRNAPRQKFTVKLFARNLVSAKAHIGIFGVAGFSLGLIAVIYFNFVDKPWFLTNLMGFAFSYGALQIMSPTTFGTGTLLLSALFFYDIYMVFFTPMMVTVAKSLDIPIKLLFPRPDIPSTDPDKPPIKQHAMLGLGDVVLPGIMIGLALRFDLYMFYLRKQIRTIVPPSPSSPTNLDVGDAPEDSADKAKGVEEAPQTLIRKLSYYSVSGRWGEYLWLAKPYHTFSFPMPYFKATMAGYVVGMLATLAAMQIADHPQPALLYLVPGVLISAWATALFRGELKEMWEFSEAADDEEDETDKSKKLSNQSILSKERTQRMEKRLENAMGKYIEADSAEESSKDQRKRDKRSTKDARDRELFHISIVAPFSLKKSRRGSKSSKSTAVSSDSDDGFKEKKNWSTGIEADIIDGSPAKRRRVS
ncbi:signal peptide peptidase-domain-containing protein [Phyllosticta capitalensis]|uniref:Intramembrane protease 2 n=1 Tax=Phyllosticta capitalensis TaxID=121624 RepID=A0ABR1YXS8_9PEZI